VPCRPPTAGRGGCRVCPTPPRRSIAGRRTHGTASVAGPCSCPWPGAGRERRQDPMPRAFGSTQRPWSMAWNATPRSFSSCTSGLECPALRGPTPWAAGQREGWKQELLPEALWPPHRLPDVLERSRFTPEQKRDIGLAHAPGNVTMADLCRVTGLAHVARSPTTLSGPPRPNPSRRRINRVQAGRRNPAPTSKAAP